MAVVGGAALIRQEAQLIKAGVVDLRGETVEIGEPGTCHRWNQAWRSITGDAVA
jgi:hypothetical protein